MNLCKRIKTVFAAGALSAALTLPAAAQAAPVKPEEASQHFAAVAKHLELGGLYFSYTDVDGDLAALAKLGDRLMNVARKSSPGFPKELSVPKIIDALGFTSVKAVGMSTRSIGRDLYHNRALLYMPDGPRGLMKLPGGKPSPLQIPSWAPADTGAALQFELRLSTLLETAEAVIKASGQDQVLGPYRLALAMPVPGLNMSAGELIGKLDTRVMVVARMDESKRISVPGAPFEIPGLQVMLALDDVDFLMGPILAGLENDDKAVVEKSDTATLIRLNSTLPGELAWFKPGIYHHKKAKRIILTSHLDMAKEAGQGSTLSGNEAFKKAMTGLPSDGNGMTYVTPEFAKAFSGWYKEVLSETMGATGVSGAQEEIIKLLWEVFGAAPETALASVYACVPDGMLFTSNTNTTHKWTIMQAALVPVVLSAAAGGAYQASIARGRLAQAESEQAPKARIAEEAPEAPDKAVKNNLQQIWFAAHTWFIDHPGDKEVTYETLVKNELVFELAPVSGESYKGLILKRTGGELSVKLKGGGSISHKYQAVTD